MGWAENTALIKCFFFFVVVFFLCKLSLFYQDMRTLVPSLNPHVAHHPIDISSFYYHSFCVLLIQNLLLSI